MSKDLILSLILKATDGMSKVVNKACKESDEAFKKTNKSLESLAGKFDNTGKSIAGFGGALAGITAVAFKTAGDFEGGMNNISTLIDTNTESFRDMSEQVLNMAKNSPKAINDLTDGLYSIRSAGIAAADQFNVLHGSEMLSVAGLSTTAEAVDVATSAINAFNLKGKEADKIYDMFFKVVKAGKTNISEFAQGFGQTAPIVASVGIQLDEYSASIAAMTTSGVKASIAHTQIKAAIAGLSRGSKEQMKIFNKLGAESFPDLVKKSGGMVNAFNAINAATGGNQSRLIQLVGSVEAYNAILALTGANNQKYLETLDEMRTGGDALSEAYEKQTGGLNSQMSIMKNNLQSLSIEFGTALLPVVKAASSGIRKLTGIIPLMPPGLKSFIAVGTAVTGMISLLGGTALMAAGSIIRNLILLRNVMVGVNLAMLANPVVVVTVGIVALGAGIVYCYNKFEGFKSICQGLWAVLKAGGAWIAVLGQNFLTGALNLWNFIKPAVQLGIEITKWTTPIGLVIQSIQKLFGWICKLIDKAGGLKGIGENMKTAAKASQGKAEAINAETKRNRGINGSHANGLNFVPFNGYVAELHTGEAVLTRKEADIWREGGNVNNSNGYDIKVEYNPVVNVYGDMTEREKQNFLQLLKNHKNEIVRLVNDVFKRREAISYA